VVAAYWLPASPLLALRPAEPPYAGLIQGMEKVRRDLERLAPDTLVIYSTRWFAVLDQLWQGRARMSGLHADENWHEYGEIPFDLTTDVSLAKACVRAALQAGIASKRVDYNGFPLDSATLMVNALLNPDGRWPTLIVSNNLYYGFDRTRELGELVARQADLQGKRVAVLALGGLSGNEWRDERALADDAIASVTDDNWNRRLLQCLEQRDLSELQRMAPDFIAQAKGDMGLKHLAFALGAMHGRLGEVKVYAYGPQYGAGAVVAKLL
jgi:2-aminophenol/2-amino-5-chlorophenol 1,6-dioxygenase alpha subunit